PSTPPALLISSFANSTPLLELIPKVASLPVSDANSPITISCARIETAKPNSAQIKKTTVKLKCDFITNSSFTPSLAHAQSTGFEKTKMRRVPPAKFFNQILDER